jgi:NMD protein affecting ribosome stability and mRNA decay
MDESAIKCPLCGCWLPPEAFNLDMLQNICDDCYVFAQNV